jgi:hypothetical protein
VDEDALAGGFAAVYAVAITTLYSVPACVNLRASARDSRRAEAFGRFRASARISAGAAPPVTDISDTDVTSLADGPLAGRPGIRPPRARVLPCGRASRKDYSRSLSP